MSIGTALARAGFVVGGLVICGAAALPQAKAATVTTKCGAVIQSTVKTQSFANFSTQSTSFTNIPGAAMNINVPEGQVRCVKIRLSIIANCSETAAIDACTLRMPNLSGEAPHPAINGVDMVTPSNNGNGAFSFQWVKKLEAGSHGIRPQVAVQNAMTTFTIGAWTFEVETSEGD